MKNLHSLLNRQIRNHFGDIKSVPKEMRSFIDLINQSYSEFDDDRNMLEHVLQLNSEELIEANSDMQGIFDALPDLLFKLNKEGRIISFKAGKSSDLPLFPKDFLGKRLSELPFSEEIKKKITIAIEKSINTQSFVSTDYLQNINDTDYYYEARCVPLINSQAIVIIRNITNRKKTERKLKEYNIELEKNVKERTQELLMANKLLEEEIRERKHAQDKISESYRRLKEVDQVKDDFIAVASHELRTPMTLIKGYASMILEDHHEEVNNEVKTQIEHILNNTKKLITLVNDMLDLAKIEAGHVSKSKMQKVDIKEAIDSIIGNFKLLTKEKNIDISNDFPEHKLPPVFYDKEKLKQILSNLIDNAIKYADEKNGVIKINTEKKANHLKISIEDNGSGIPEESREKIFKKFGMAESPLHRRKSGTGLGLAICKQIVEGFGGDIWADASSIDGAKLIFTIPIINH